MSPILLFIALAPSLIVSTAILSKLSQELIDDGLIARDGNGVPTTACMVSAKDGSSRIQLCAMTEGFGPRSVGCFAVWNKTAVVQQGCYSNQEISLRSQCTRRACSSAGRKHRGIAFCCCHGALCNASHT